MHSWQNGIIQDEEVEVMWCHSHLCWFLLSFFIVFFKNDEGGSRVYNRKSVQLPYGFYTHHLDRMTYAISSEYAKL